MTILLVHVVAYRGCQCCFHFLLEGLLVSTASVFAFLSIKDFVIKEVEVGILRARGWL